MRFLCVCHTVSSRLSPILEWIANQPGNDLIIAVDRTRKGMEIAKTQKVKLKRPEIKKTAHTVLDYWQIAIQRGKSGQESLLSIAENGFRPDIILHSTLNGILLGIKDIFPQAFLVAYLDSAYTGNAIEDNFRNRFLSLLALESDLTFRFQNSLTSPKANHENFIPLMVNASFFKPHGAIAKANLPEIIFSLKGLNESEYARWFKILEKYSQNTDNKILALLPDIGKLKDLEFLRQGDKNNISCACNLDNVSAVSIFQNAKLLIWPGTVTGMELLQAMSCKTPVALLSGHFPQLAENAYLSFPRQNICEWLKKLDLKSEGLKLIGANAREFVLKKFDANKLMPIHMDKICEVIKKR